MYETAIKYDLQVQDDGKLELQVPWPKGTFVSIFVVHIPPDEFNDLASAATSSLDFWDNPIDDEVWNNA